MGEVLHGEPGVIPQAKDEALSAKMERLHDRECEVAAMAVLKERARFRPTNK
jgi:hypothetical protein